MRDISARELKGHNILAVERFQDSTRWMVEFMLNEFIEKVVVHEGEGRGNSRRQRIDIYLNFIGAFEVPAHIVTPMEAEEQRRQQEEQAAKEAHSQELAKAREEKRKAEKTYDATVVLEDTGQYVNFKLEFDRQKGGGK